MDVLAFLSIHSEALQDYASCYYSDDLKVNHGLIEC